MKVKSVLCSFVALTMAASLGACSGSGDASQSADSTGSAAASGSSAASAKRGKITATIYDRGKVPSAEGTIENNRWTKWINENGPVDVEFVAIPRVGSTEKLNVLFASGTAPDLIFEYAPSAKVPLYQQKQLMPIDEMIEQYSTTYKQLMQEYPGLDTAGRMDDGKLYQFGRTHTVKPLRGVMIRTDWLEKLGLQVPKTLEEYYNVIQAFTTQDPDGNGQKDTYGFALSYNAGGTFDQMIPGGEIGIVDGKYQYTWDRLQTRLDFKKRLYDEGLVDKEFMTDKNGARAVQDFVNGKLGIFPWLMNPWENFLKTEYKTLKTNVPEAKIEFIPFPETPWGVTYMPTVQNPIQMTAVVNAACKDPESVMKFVDFAFSDAFTMALTYGIEGEHYKLVDGMPQVIDQEKSNNEVSWAIDFTMLVNDFTLEKLQSQNVGFNLDDAFEKECYEIYKNAVKTYLDPSLTYPDFSHSEHMPQLPKDIKTVQTNLNIGDLYDKAVVSGADYTVEQAISDAKAGWEKGGGQQILDWYQKWYETESQNAFSAEAIKEIMVEQDLVGKFN